MKKVEMKKRYVFFNLSKGIGIKRMIPITTSTLKIMDEVIINGEKYLLTGIGTIK